MFSLDPSSSDFLSTLEFFLRVIGGIGGLSLFIIGFGRYSKSQYWKMNEFVANEMKEFNQDRMVKNAKLMLDWDKRNIELFPEKEDYNERFFMVDREKLRSALMSHRLKNVFKKEEVAIRDTFDHFFDHLEKFHHFIEAGLITEKELAPYLRYWMNVIGETIEPRTKNVIHHYINEYQFKGVQELFMKFNKNVIPVTPLESCASSEPADSISGGV